MADDRLESHPAEIVFVGNCAKLRLDICRRILRKFSENTRHALSIEWLYMNCQHNELTRNTRVPDN